MAFFPNMNRRHFLKTMASGATVGLAVTSLPACVFCPDARGPTVGTGPDWAPIAGKARWRIDGLTKVLGEKIYARDFKARDFPGWPATENWAYALRADRFDQVVVDYDLGLLPPELKPIAVVDNNALLARKLNTASEMNPGSHFFTPLGQAAEFYGQPVAILIFADFDRYRRALRLLQFNPKTIVYGAAAKPMPSVYNPPTSYVRDDSQNFNYVYTPDYNARQDAVAADIRKTMAATPSWKQFQRRFYTQTIDPMFMEPESGLAWYDGANKTLNLVLGTQSAMGDINAAASIFDGSDVPLSQVELLSCYPGGGFGGRDQSYFSMYLAVVAPFASGALRWQQNRFEQFQVGLKRCESDFTETLAVDGDGHIQVLDCDFNLNGGGQKNLSPYVAQLAALSAMGSYDIPRAIATGRSMHTPQLLGGSQRGFGGPQAFMAIETLLDEAAAALRIDPFDLRRRNLLFQGQGATVTGAPVLQDLQLIEQLSRLENHSLWQNRFAVQKEKAAKGLRYGVGLALANEAYGTSGDGMYAAVQIDGEGRLRVYTPYIDMGNGAATALGLAPARFLGRNADDIAMGETALFDQLGLVQPSSPPTVPTPANEVLKGAGSASACLAAFHQYHVAEQAAQALLRAAVLPAANSLWRSALSAEELRWRDGRLSAGELPPLDWPTLVARIQLLELPRMAAVHASFVASFARARFAFVSGTAELPLDYVAVGSDRRHLGPVTRSDLVNPPAINSRFGRSTYAPSGSLVAATLDPRTGQVSVDEVVTVLSAGVQHCPELVSGQSEGAVAMAIGNVLWEDCPNGNDGPGNGQWNLDRYRVTRLPETPRQELIVLPPAPGETTARGIAEAVMCPLAPALLNALAMATGGHRFTRTPVTPTAILEALK